MEFWVVQKWTKIEAAGRSEGRDRGRLKGNGKTENLKRLELAANRQKNQKYLQPQFFPTFFPQKLLPLILLL